MASLMKAMHYKTITQSKLLPSIQQVRNHWNKDWKPKKLPQTQEEREAAAAKYGIPIEKYENYPDDGRGLGDYPKLPDISGESRDPYYAYDFPEMKRNFQEPIHADSDMYGEDRYDISGRQRFSMTYMISCFVGFVGGMVLVYRFLDGYKIVKPVLEKQLPKPGVVHYTFEPKS